MKKGIFLLLALVLLILPVTATETADSVRSMIGNLPTVEEFKAMSREQQADAYNRTQYAYDAYMALPTAEEKQAIVGAEEKFDALFSHFNTLIMPIENGEARGKVSNNRFIWVVPAALAAAMLLPQLRKKRT